MINYLSNFFEHSGQITALASIMAVWLGFTSIGAYIGGSNRFQEATPFLGWAFISFIFTIGGVFTSISFTTMTIPLALLAIIFGVLTYRRDGSILPPGFTRIVILTLPILILVSAMVGSQWDEFTDWLLTPRQLLENDHFPNKTNKSLSGALAAYPFNWHFVTFLASRFTGHLEESAGALFNILLLLSFGLYLARMIKDKINFYDNITVSKPSWSLCALGALLTTAFNPTFAQKVVLTSYADVSVAVAVGFAVSIGWQILNAISENHKENARILSFQLGLLFIVLINLKQVTFVLFILIAGATVITAARDPKIKMRDLFSLLPIIIIPALVVYLTWRYHVALQLEGKEFSIRPPAEWYIAEIPQILLRMLLVLTKKGLYLFIFICVVFFAIGSLFRLRTSFDRLALMVGIVMLGYNAFLLFSYVSAFGKSDALRAASLWRYNMHLGPIAILFYVYGLIYFFKRNLFIFLERQVTKNTLIILIVITPFIFAEKMRFDRAKHVPFFRSIGAELNQFLKDENSLIVIDPKGSGESAAVTRFQLNSRGIYKNYISLHQKPTLAHFIKIFESDTYSHALVHSINSDLQKGLGQKLEKNYSYLLSKEQNTWTTIKRWPTPENFQFQ